jgi:hypothetical protein
MGYVDQVHYYLILNNFKKNNLREKIDKILILINFYTT